jgi:hypothetical protein
MTTTCDEWRAKLAAAETAFETLMMGGAVVSIRMGEKEVKYSAANRGDLSTYLRWLQRKVDACDGRCGRFGFIHITPVDS